MSCFLLAAGVNISINRELGARGLAEIPVSDLTALAHPAGGGAPRDPAEVQGCGPGAVGHRHL